MKLEDSNITTDNAARPLLIIRPNYTTLSTAAFSGDRRERHDNHFSLIFIPNIIPSNEEAAQIHCMMMTVNEGTGERNDNKQGDLEEGEQELSSTVDFGVLSWCLSTCSIALTFLSELDVDFCSISRQGNV
jgi:hypothetical protein